MAKKKMSKKETPITENKPLPSLAGPVEPKQEDGVPQDYEIENAADTLMKAEKIKQDKRLMPHVHKHLKHKQKAIRSIQDLKDARDAMMKEEEGEND